VQWLAVLFLAELFTFTAMAFFEDAIAAIVVLALFVPLCISTGGNSGTQAATLVTRAMALGFVSPKDWRKVLMRELVMGLALGGALGLIAFARGALTPSDTRSGPEKVKNPFTVLVPTGTNMIPNQNRDIGLAAGTPQTVTLEKNTRVRLPEEVKQLDDPKTTADGLIYEFPAECEVRTEPVSRWELGFVISMAVMGICLWGTLMGCMIPLVIRTLGGDPAIASGALVATLVDVSGIVIFFSVAKTVLL
jgi:magnesium transporter